MYMQYFLDRELMSEMIFPLRTLRTGRRKTKQLLLHVSNPSIPRPTQPLEKQDGNPF